MDLDKSIIYRTFDFNALTTVGKVMDGCTVQRVGYGNVEIVGYLEKRALDDGYDATDVFLGKRSIRIEGTLYGSTRGRLFDLQRAMRYALDPVLAKLESPYDKGFLPLTFEEPTDNIIDWPEGSIPMMMKVRAALSADTIIDRDETGGGKQGDDAPVSVPYRVQFVASDPRVYHRDRTEEQLVGASGTATLTNRGGHPVPLNIMLVADSNPTLDRTFSFVGGGADFEVLVPAGPDKVVIRLDGYAKGVTLSASDIERPAAHLRSISEWPVLQLGDTEITWTFKRSDDVDAMLKQQSVLFYREAFS